MPDLSPAQQAVFDRMAWDTPLFAENCITIVDKGGAERPLVARPAQLKLDAALEAQRAAGKPMRAIVLKSRRTGISTWVQAKMLQRLTRMSNRRAEIVAHDGDTAAELFDISWHAYVSLPDDAWSRTVPVKPPLASHRNTANDRHLHFGYSASQTRVTGERGLNSRLTIDTANEVEAGRGKTRHDLHISEMAFWKDPKGKDISRKALALINTVGYEPETLVVIESTANGSNAFKARWDRAYRGEGSFTPVFIGWLDDPDCSLAFESAEEREQFVEQIGTGTYGKDEPRLVEKGATPEQLHWRRMAIVDLADGKIEYFKQEYPSSPEEAFIASGKHVFSIEFVSRVLDRVEIIEQRPASAVELAGPQEGLLMPVGTIKRKLAYGEAEVPTSAVWVPKEATGFGASHPFWTVWRHPWPGIEEIRKRYGKGLLTDAEMAAAHQFEKDPPGQYIVSVDAGGDEESSSGQTAFSAIQVIDHATGDQVARYASREDTDEFARLAYLVGTHYNLAWVAVEITGSYGMPIARTLQKTLGYRRVYQRPKSADLRDESQDKRRGWSTDRRTKPLIEENLRQLLREGHDGIRDRETALELTTYVILNSDRSEHGPDEDAFADRLMAWMIASYLRSQIPMRRPAAPGQSFSSLTRDLPL